MPKSDKILKSYRLSIETITKISEIKNKVLQKSQKNISYGDIVESAFKYTNINDLTDFIINKEIEQ